VSAAEPPLLDAHAHVWGPAVPYSHGAWTRLDYAFEVDDYLDCLDRHGVRYGVIAAASLFGTNSTYTLEALRTHRRLRGTVIVEPTVDPAVLKAMRDSGVVGVRLQWFNIDPMPDLRRADWRTLLQQLRELDMHVHVNIEGGRLPQVLAPIAESGVKLVIDHFGWSDSRLDPTGAGLEAVFRYCQAGKAWVKLSSGFRFADPQVPVDQAARLISEVGTDRLFWGSDAPFVGMEDRITYADVVRLFAEWVPDPARRREIGETAYRFYFG
jgi:predicted TIM-barrel fold metal-dependent hydrolase